MLKLQNSANLKFYYLIPGFSTDFKKRKDLFNDGIKYFFDLNEEEGYEIAIKKISLSKFLLIEKSQFADDLQGNFVYNKDPFYLSVCFDYIPCQIVEERSEYYRNLCDKIAERFFTALLLVHPELELFNPVDYIVYQQKK